MSGLDDGAAEADREVGLADAGRTEQQDILGAGDEVARRKLAHQPLIHRRLELEVELFEQLHRREMRDLDAHRDALLLLGVELVAEDLVEEVEVGRLFAGSLRQDRVEPRGHRAEAQSQ